MSLGILHDGFENPRSPLLHDQRSFCLFQSAQESGILKLEPGNLGDQLRRSCGCIGGRLARVRSGHDRLHASTLGLFHVPPEPIRTRRSRSASGAGSRDALRVPNPIRRIGLNAAFVNPKFSKIANSGREKQSEATTLLLADPRALLSRALSARLHSRSRKNRGELANSTLRSDFSLVLVGSRARWRFDPGGIAPFAGRVANQKPLRELCPANGTRERTLGPFFARRGTVVLPAASET